MKSWGSRTKFFLATFTGYSLLPNIHIFHAVALFVKHLTLALEVMTKH